MMKSKVMSFLAVLFFLLITVLPKNSILAYPSCIAGQCVYGCTPLCVSGCYAACEFNCYISGECGYDASCPGSASKYRYDGCCYGWECSYGGPCSRVCECTNTCAPSCTAGCGSCNTGTYYSSKPSGYYTCGSRGCTNANCSTYTQDCYCACTACEPCTGDYQTYSDAANTLYGSISRSCTNTPTGVGCGSTTKTCSCKANCTPASCPSPLLSANPPGDPNMILEKFTDCENLCEKETIRDCFEDRSDQPTVELNIIPDSSNHYGFLSNTHSGEPVSGQGGQYLGNLNNPINMQATYTDDNGANDIEGLFVWFRGTSYTGQVTSPVWLSTSSSATPQTSANDTWGFMIHRTGDTWSAHRPYVPSYAPSPSVWRRRSYLTNELGQRYFYIHGAGGSEMVKVTIVSIAYQGNVVTMDFRLHFSGTDISEYVREITYNTYLLGLDKFSFTPHDNYSFTAAFQTKFETYWPVNKLRYRTSPTVGQSYARNWTQIVNESNIPVRWTIDKHSPRVNTFTINNIPDQNKLRVTWNVEDIPNTNGNARGLYAVVGNIFTSANLLDSKSISLVGSSDVSVRDAFTPENQVDTKIGRLVNVPIEPYYWSFKTSASNLSVNSHSGWVEIDIGENRTGTLYVYLSVFDDAGNIYRADQNFNLGDWFVTDGGLVYSREGTSFQTRILDEPAATTAWNGSINLPPGQPRILPTILNSNILGSESLIPSKADFSSEMWADSVSTSDPTSLLKSVPSPGIVKSYNIKQFAGHKVDNYYQQLMSAYEKRREYLLAKTTNQNKLFTEIPNIGNSINGPLGVGGACANYQYCVLFAPGDLNVSTLNCNTKAVIFVNGRLIINPNSTYSHTTYNNSACIFVVKEDVVITPGSNQSTPAQGFKYDVLYGYILTDGKITISKDRPDDTTMHDGLYINGGIQARGGIEIYRYLRLQERLMFPLLAVDHHPKYGVLGGILFGSNFTLQKVEVGFK